MCCPRYNNCQCFAGSDLVAGITSSPNNDFPLNDLTDLLNRYGRLILLGTKTSSLSTFGDDNHNPPPATPLGLKRILLQ